MAVKARESFSITSPSRRVSLVARARDRGTDDSEDVEPASIDHDTVTRSVCSIRGQLVISKPFHRMKHRKRQGSETRYWCSSRPKPGSPYIGLDLFRPKIMLEVAQVSIYSHPLSSIPRRGVLP